MHELNPTFKCYVRETNCGWTDIHMDRQRDGLHENTIPDHKYVAGCYRKENFWISENNFFCRNMKSYDIFE